MTAFYVFRSIFLAFFGKYRGDQHPHESPLIMTAPLMVLALLSLFGGFIPVPHFLEPIFPHQEHGEHGILGYIATAAGLGGILLAYLFYVAKSAARRLDGNHVPGRAIDGFITSTSSMKPTTPWWSNPWFRAHAPCFGEASMRRY